MNLLPTKIVQIKVKALQVKDQVVRCGLKTGSAIVSLMLYATQPYSPLHSVHEFAATRFALVLVVALHDVTLHEGLEALL